MFEQCCIYWEVQTCNAAEQCELLISLVQFASLETSLINMRKTSAPVRQTYFPFLQKKEQPKTRHLTAYRQVLNQNWPPTCSDQAWSIGWTGAAAMGTMRRDRKSEDTTKAGGAGYPEQKKCERPDHKSRNESNTFRHKRLRTSRHKRQHARGMVDQPAKAYK